MKATQLPKTKNGLLAESINPTELIFYLLTTKLNAKSPINKQQLKAAAVKAWKSILWTLAWKLS